MAKLQRDTGRGEAGGGGWRGVDKEMKCSKRENSKSHVCGKTNCLKCIYGLPLSLAVSQSVSQSASPFVSRLFIQLFILRIRHVGSIFLLRSTMNWGFQMFVAFYMCKNYLANTLQGQGLKGVRDLQLLPVLSNVPFNKLISQQTLLFTGYLHVHYVCCSHIATLASGIAENSSS